MAMTMLIVEKSGNIKTLIYKSYFECELYKKAGHKSKEHFNAVHTWNVSLENKTYNITLFGKTVGKANYENKYDFPAPVDKTLFFGNCLLVNKNDNGQCIPLTVNEWETIYENLFGGFEDLEDELEDGDIISEEDLIDLPITKSGYLKDGFIVDDNEVIDEYESGDEEDESEMGDETGDEIIVKPPKKKGKEFVKGGGKRGGSRTKKGVEMEVSENYLDCKNELSEESYFSD
jgi:hypothetical protein